MNQKKLMIKKECGILGDFHYKTLLKTKSEERK